MKRVTVIFLLLLVLAFSGCAPQFQTPEQAQTISQTEQREQRREQAMPTITYNPGR
jgi:hypothetical protein